MITLVLGVPDSGKSELAEQLATECLPGAKKLYIATMIPQGEAGAARVEKHRQNRAGKDFLTIECPVKLETVFETVKVYSPAVCLLECVSNLVGNEMHLAENADADPEMLADRITADIMGLSAIAAELIVVSNEFDEDAPDYDDETRAYVKLTALVNERLLDRADKVFAYRDGGFVLHENP